MRRAARFKQDKPIDAALVAAYLRGGMDGYMRAAMHLGLNPSEATARMEWISSPSRTAYRERLAKEYREAFLT